MRQLLLVLLLAAPAAARQSSVSPELDKILMEGLDGIYRMDFDAADAASAKAIALNPDDPHAYLGQAATDFIRFAYGSEQTDEKLTRSFETKIDRAVAVAERSLKARPNDPDLLLVLGSGYGIAAKLALDRHEWLKGWRSGSKSMKYIRASIKADPEIYDSYLGLGMFDYYVATIPKFMGWLAKFMLGGNRARGLEEIHIAAEKGRYTKTAAQLILVEIDTEDDFGARNTTEAVHLMSEIRAQYPDSPMLHSAGVDALYEDGRYDDALKDAREYMARAASGRYPAVDLSKGHMMVGTALWGAGKKDEALAEFHASAEAVPKTRWSVWSRVREGQLLDAFGRRAEALVAYRDAYAEPDRWEFRAIIKPCLSKPCVGNKFPGHFSPD